MVYHGMYMPYTTNPHLPKIRLDAVRLIKEGWSSRKVARYTGFNQSTIVRWSKKDIWHQKGIATLSSRPHSHPRKLSQALVEKIIEYRLKHHRCAEVLHYLLKKDGISVSLSSVKRTLRRHHLVNHSKWKKWHVYPPRPMPERPGILVEIDTIVDGPIDHRLYVYTLLDVCSRWAFALPFERISARKSVEVVGEARFAAPFEFTTLQSDHGSEFSKYFTKQLFAQGLIHRHSRVRTPTDNGHLERFNRTIQEECLSRIPRKLSLYRKEIPEYLRFYNTERPHMGLNMKTPSEVMRSY
jgi:transposase InsO family protein